MDFLSSTETYGSISPNIKTPLFHFHPFPLNMETSLSLFHLFHLLNFFQPCSTWLYHLCHWNIFFEALLCWKASPRQFLTSFVDPDFSISQPYLPPPPNNTSLCTARKIVSHTVFQVQLPFDSKFEISTKRPQTTVTKHLNKHPNTWVCFW